MVMETGTTARDVWIKYTDKDGASSVVHHRAWDVGLLMESKIKQAQKEGGRAESIMPPERAKR